MKISLINTKGGVGKTTTAIVLAEILTGKTLLIDASQESNLTAYYQVPIEFRKKNIYTLLFEKSKLKDCIYSKNGVVDIIPASVKTSDDYKFKDNKILNKILNPLPYSYVIIDTQPSFGNLVRSCVIFSDIVIIPVDMDLWSAEAALILAGNIKELKKDIKLYFLPTKYRNNKIAKQVIIFLEANNKNIDVLPAIKFNSKTNKISFEGKLDNNKLIKNYKKSMEGIL